MPTIGHCHYSSWKTLSTRHLENNLKLDPDSLSTIWGQSLDGVVIFQTSKKLRGGILVWAFNLSVCASFTLELVYGQEWLELGS